MHRCLARINILEGKINGRVALPDFDYGTCFTRCLAGNAVGKVAIAGASGNIVIADFETGSVITSFAHGGPIRRLLTTSNGDRLISAGEDGWVKAWRWDTLGLEREFVVHDGWADACATKDGTIMCTCGADSRLYVFDANFQMLASFTADAGLRRLAISQDGRRIIVGDELGQLHFLQIRGTESKANSSCGTLGEHLLQEEARLLKHLAIYAGSLYAVQIEEARVQVERCLDESFEEYARVFGRYTARGIDAASGAISVAAQFMIDCQDFVGASNLLGKKPLLAPSEKIMLQIKNHFLDQ